MAGSWIIRHPDWYVQEREILARHYPQLKVDEEQLARGVLDLYGDLLVRPPGGAHRHAIQLQYPPGTPYEHPMVIPLQRLPAWNDEGTGVTGSLQVRYYSVRHQMPAGNLCLFQRDTRVRPGGDPLDAVAVLRRATHWFLGLHTGRWPPDTAESELESHFHPVGDVLVAITFFDSEMGARGRFYFVPDMRRLVDSDYDAFPPRIITCATKEDGLIQTFDARAELSRLYPWINTEFWDATDQIAKKTHDADDRQRLEHGYWWALSEELKPTRNGAGLLEALAPVTDDGDAWKQMRDTLGGDLASKFLHFAFRFPARAGGVEWLFLSMMLGERKAGGGTLVESDKELRGRFERADLVCMRVARLDPETLRFRNTGVVQPTVSDKCVALIGLGALGSHTAELLCKAGVGRLRLCDLGRLEIGNVTRHVGGIDQFGERKTTVVARRLLAVNPYLEFAEDDILDASAASDIGRLQAFLDAADLVVCTTADEGVEALVNEIALRRRKTVVYGRALRDGSMGRVFLVRPGMDACKACIAGYISAKRRGKEAPPELIDVPEDEQRPLLHECGRPVIAGSGVDLSFVSTLAARVALDFLEDPSFDQNHWVWSRRGESDLDNRLRHPLSTVASRVIPDRSCPVCQEPEIRQVILPATVRQQIEAETVSSPDKETGGVLIGYIEKHHAVVVRATGPGPMAVRSRTIFRRDVAFTQRELDKAADELGVQGLYIGEWHSHLVPSPSPSPTDVDSLVGIAHAPNYLTRCPVMLIAGFDVPKGDVAQLDAWAFPVGGRVYEIELNAADPA